MQTWYGLLAFTVYLFFPSNLLSLLCLISVPRLPGL